MLSKSITAKVSTSVVWEFVSRGAMIIRPPGCHGADIILPVCFKGNALTRDNMMAVLFQVRNKEDIPGNLFDSTDPFDVGLFSDGDRCQ